MTRLRWLLAFALLCAVDFANPLAAVAHELRDHEALEAVEESIPIPGHRRAARVEAPDRRAPRVALHRDVPVDARLQARAVAGRSPGGLSLARKVPALVSDSRPVSAPGTDPDAH